MISVSDCVYKGTALAFEGEGVQSSFFFPFSLCIYVSKNQDW